VSSESVDAEHARPEGVPDDAVRAAGTLSEALEYLERARGHLYSFHQLIGRADLLLDDVSRRCARPTATTWPSGSTANCSG
jgi:hypothetical protein